MDGGESGGHRTVQILLARGAPAFELPELPLALSTAAWLDERYVALDVDPEEDWAMVVARLDELQAEGRLTWLDASAHPIVEVVDDPIG